MGNYPYIILYRPYDRQKNLQKQERISEMIFLDGHNIYLVTLFILSVTSLKIKIFFKKSSQRRMHITSLALKEIKD